jgi:hypothetical protein
MSASNIDVLGDLLTWTVTGQLTQHDLAEAQRQVAELMRSQPRVRLLVIVQDFQGWQRGDDWEDLTFQNEHDAQIERMAIVGEKKWEELTGAFVGKGFREFPIAYFAPTELAQARAWLNAK